MNLQSIQIFLICLIAVFAFQAVAETQEVGTMRIFGGLPITIDKTPYIVQIRLDDPVGHYCGGTLVSKRFVVTAAHCMTEKDISKLRVVGGATTTTEEGVQRRIVNVSIPDTYSSKTVHNDIAVLKLDKDMEGSNIETMALCNHELKPKEMIQVSGWGFLTHLGIKSDKLMTISIPVQPKEKCAKNYLKKNHVLTELMFCASEPGKKDSCSSDSGGPAIYDEQLCGVVSWGTGCGEPDYPGVYTDVLKVRGFIEEAMKY